MRRTLISGSLLLLTACAVTTNKWEDSAYRWKMNSRSPFQTAAGYVDSSTITQVPGDAEYLNTMKEAVQAGDPYAQWHLAIASSPYWGGEGTEEEIKKLYLDAYNTFKQIAEKTEDPEALYMIGIYYEGGERDPEEWSPLEENLETAFDYYMRAANSGFPPAQYNVGLAYSVGEGVIENKELAIEWQKKAALQGEAEYQESLGVHYCSGLGCDNPTEAIKWYEMAAKQGHRQAQRRLAKMYADDGLILVHNPAKALEWFKECAMLGDDDCLGEMWWAYQYGEGAIVNPYKAYVWLLVDKAATTNEPFGYDFRKEEFEEQLSSTQISQAQSEAEQLLKTIQDNKKTYPYFF